MKRQGAPFGSRILPAESAASRFLPAAAAQFQKSGSSFPGCSHCCHGPFHRSAPALPREGARFWAAAWKPASQNCLRFPVCNGPGSAGAAPGAAAGFCRISGARRHSSLLSAAPSPQQCCDGRKVQVLESPGEGVAQHPGELPDLAVNVPGRHRHTPLLLS